VIKKTKTKVNIFISHLKAQNELIIPKILVNILLMLNTRNEYVRAEFIKGFNYLIDSFKSNHSATFEVYYSFA